MRTIVQGVNFLTHYVRNEIFSFSWRTNTTTFHNSASLGGIYPYLLVNIGSGVSILRCTARDKFERVSGSSLGGGMFWGLCKLLAGIDNFNDVKRLSSLGDNANVDLLVGDIYGDAYSNIGLGANVIASSFGKIAHMTAADKGKKFNEADLIRSLVRNFLLFPFHFKFNII